jgi:hypothetical protein
MSISLVSLGLTMTLIKSIVIACVGGELQLSAVVHHSNDSYHYQPSSRDVLCQLQLIEHVQPSQLKKEKSIHCLPREIIERPFKSKRFLSFQTVVSFNTS